MLRLYIRIRPSRWRERILRCLLAGAGVSSVGVIVWGHSWLAPLLLTLLAGLLFSLNSEQIDDQLSITENGEGRWASDQSTCQLLPGSLLTPFLLALRLSTSTPTASESHFDWYLIYPDQMTRRGWRRLRRIALNLRH